MARGVRFLGAKVPGPLDPTTNVIAVPINLLDWSALTSLIG